MHTGRARSEKCDWTPTRAATAAAGTTARRATAAAAGGSGAAITALDPILTLLEALDLDAAVIGGEAHPLLQLRNISESWQRGLLEQPEAYSSNSDRRNRRWATKL